MSLVYWLMILCRDFRSVVKPAGLMSVEFLHNFESLLLLQCEPFQSLECCGYLSRTDMIFCLKRFYVMCWSKSVGSKVAFGAIVRVCMYLPNAEAL